MSELAERMIRVRAEHRISQERLAELAGLSRNTISNIERGIGVTERATGVSVAEVLDMIEDVQPHDPAGLRQRRVACGLSQVDLAKLANVSTTTIRNAETGRVSEPRTRERIERALTHYESLPAARTAPLVPPNSLAYTTGDGTTHLVDGEQWDPASLSPRERAVCRALLTYALGRLNESEVTP